MASGIIKTIIKSPLTKSSRNLSSLSSLTLNKLFIVSCSVSCFDKFDLELSTKPISIGSLSPSLSPTMPSIRIGRIRLKIIYCLFLKKICMNTFVK